MQEPASCIITHTDSDTHSNVTKIQKNNKVKDLKSQPCLTANSLLSQNLDLGPVGIFNYRFPFGFILFRRAQFLSVRSAPVYNVFSPLSAVHTFSPDLFSRSLSSSVQSAAKAMSSLATDLAVYSVLWNLLLSSVALWCPQYSCPAMLSSLLLSICPSQFHFILHSWSSTGSCSVFLCNSVSVRPISFMFTVLRKQLLIKYCLLFFVYCSMCNFQRLKYA